MNAGFTGSWVVQLVEHLTLPLRVILRFVSSSPASGSGLTAQSLGPVLDSLSPFLSLPLPHSYSVDLSKTNKTLKKSKRKKESWVPRQVLEGQWKPVEDNNFLFYLFIYYFNVYLFLERQRQSMSRGGTEREGDAESEAGSRLCADSSCGAGAHEP